MNFLKGVESVGWGFFAGATAVLSPPCIALLWRSAKPESSAAERILLGVVLAVILAAVLAWAVNDQLHRRALRRHAIDEKTEKQKKRTK